MKHKLEECRYSEKVHQDADCPTAFSAQKVSMTPSRCALEFLKLLGYVEEESSPAKSLSFWQNLFAFILRVLLFLYTTIVVYNNRLLGTSGARKSSASWYKRMLTSSVSVAMLN